MNYFRGIVHDRSADLTPNNAAGKHRYLIAGILVTQEPIKNFEGGSGGQCGEHSCVLDGLALGMADALEGIEKRPGSSVVRGTINDILLNLNHIVAEPTQEAKPKKKRTKKNGS